MSPSGFGFLSLSVYIMTASMLLFEEQEVTVFRAQHGVL